MPLISFIITTFNASLFIDRCLASILFFESALPEFEIIVVDDASTDNTVEIIKRYAENNKNIKLICQPKNHRIGAARNKALTISKGQYIAFVDSDDVVASGIITSIKMAKERDLDMVAMCFAKISLDGVINEVHLPASPTEVFSGIDMLSQYPFYNGSVWRYIYKKSYLDYVQYPFVEDVLYEDMDFICTHLYRANRMSYCDECAYRYYENPVSITNTISFKHLCDYALLGTRMLRIYESLNDKTDYYAKMVLEGGSFNIKEAFRKLPRLRSCLEVRAFYDRFDSHYERKILLGYREPAYCLNWWTRFCLKHRRITIVIVGCTIPFVRMIKK